MIVYKKDKTQFLEDVSEGAIEDIIRENVKSVLKRKTGESEYSSWKNSMQFVFHVLNNHLIPNGAIITIEYNIPGTSNRIDFIITGRDEQGLDHLVLIELKQWTEVRKTEKDAIVSTRFKHGQSDEPHPSYQAWSYATLLEGFNTEVYQKNIKISPCAYLHNHQDSGILSDPFYKDYLIKAPSFFKGEKKMLQEFIIRNIKAGDDSDIIGRIDQAKIRPSKPLADAMAKMIKGNEAFVMIDDQKVILENARAMACSASAENKKVLIVIGGPGTGKSVVAINLLVGLTKKGLNTNYVTRNAAPRSVYQSKLTGTLTKNRFSAMFKGSGSYHSTAANEFDALIVDEAHRLNTKSGMFKNEGENQVKELINASKFSVFFLDEDQRVTVFDIGDEQEIKKWANYYNAEVTVMKLNTQFRCGGSDGYLAWLDDALEIRETANQSIKDLDYEFKLFDDPNSLRNAIIERNRERNSARIVAGYCWDWPSKSNKLAMDAVMAEHHFAMQWNLDADGMNYLIADGSVDQIGCIHTCQGLELDYIGVIIGNDLLYRDGKLIVDPYAHPTRDKALSGYKGNMKKDPIGTMQLMEVLIKNNYRTLMSRGMKGCYLFCRDKDTQECFKARMAI